MRSSAPVEFTGRLRPRVVERIGHGRRFLETHHRSIRSKAGGRPAPPPAARASGLGEPRHELAPHRREAVVRRAGHLVRDSHEVASQGRRAAVHQGRSPRALPTCRRRGVADLSHDRPAVRVDPVARPARSQLPGQQRAARAVVAACRAAAATAATTASISTGVGRDDRPPAAPTRSATSNSTSATAATMMSTSAGAGSRRQRPAPPPRSAQRAVLLGPRERRVLGVQLGWRARARARGVACTTSAPDQRSRTCSRLRSSWRATRRGGQIRLTSTYAICSRRLQSFM